MFRLCLLFEHVDIGKVFDFRSGDYGELAENSAKWTERFEKVSILAELEVKLKSNQMAMLRHCVDDEGLRILNFTEREDGNDMRSARWTFISPSKLTIY